MATREARAQVQIDTAVSQFYVENPELRENAALVSGVANAISSANPNMDVYGVLTETKKQLTSSGMINSEHNPPGKSRKKKTRRRKRTRKPAGSNSTRSGNGKSSSKGKGFATQATSMLHSLGKLPTK